MDFEYENALNWRVKEWHNAYTEKDLFQLKEISSIINKNVYE